MSFSAILPMGFKREGDNFNFNLGSIPAGGGAFTVKVNFLTPQKTSWSTSCRQIMDLSDWDRSLSVISSGQSGHFMSRFYDDQRHIWANGAYHPQLFSPQVIEKNAVHVLILKPKKNLDRSPDDE